MAQEHVKRQVAAATVATTVLFLYQVTRILASAPTSVPAPQYQLDPTFPALNSTTATLFTAVAVDHTLATPEIYVAQRSADYPQPILVYDYQGQLLRAWGNGTISFIGGEFGVHGICLQFTPTGTFLLVADMLEHTLKKFTPEGQLVAVLGTPNIAGNGTDPLQFGNVADIAIGENAIFVADGDGGVNNRVVALSLDFNPTPLFLFGEPGQGPAQFSSPHSVTYHNASNTFMVADRGNNRTQLFSAEGQYIGEWTCMRPGTPWGLRILENSASDLLFEADGNSQLVNVFSASQLSSDSIGPCLIEETILILPTECSTPHEIAVDQLNGDLYVACIGAAHSNIIRFVPSAA